MLNLVNLNFGKTRQFMLQEVEADCVNGLYLCKHFSAIGEADYPALMKEAVCNYDDGWLADNLRTGGRLNTMAQRRKPKGGYTPYHVPINAADVFSEGEFNRFYARGLCCVAQEASIPSLLIYRAKAVLVPRPDSEMKIGSLVDANSLLRDLRAHQGMETALGIPGGPNSGISVMLPDS